jgi:excisionase family DNA binding protein
VSLDSTRSQIARRRTPINGLPSLGATASTEPASATTGLVPPCAVRVDPNRPRRRYDWRQAPTPPSEHKPARMVTAPLPQLLTAEEVAALLRTTPKAIYVMVERRQLPEVTRIGRRLLFRQDELLDWLRQKSAPSPKGPER